MKNKIIIFICLFALVLSVLVVPSFALDSSYYGEYLFNEVLYLPNYNITYSLEFLCNGIGYTGIHVSYRGDEYYYVSYIMSNANTGNDEYVDVYHNGWVDESYRSLNIYRIGDDESTVQFLNNNEFIPSPESYYGWYYDIYYMLESVIFDGGPDNAYQELALSLVSLILCLVAVIMPILVVLFLIKFVLSMRFI